MLDNYFNYKKHRTDFKTEVIAGVSTFLTMAYIMFLNPVILADGGFDFGGVFTATALATALACFIAAFYAKTWPVGLAPGMGINAFIAYGVCLGMKYTPAEALGAVLVAGVVFLIISLTPIRAWLINSIPKSLKLGIGAGIGLFLAIIGFELMGLTTDNPVVLVQLGDMSNPLTLLGAAAFISMIVMEKMKIKGNIIIGIVVFSAIAWVTGLANFNGVVSSPPPMTHLMTFDLGAALSASMVTVIFTLLGGLFVIRSGVLKAMFLAGIIMASTNLLFSVLAWSDKSELLFAIAVIFDDIAAAFATVAFVAFISLLVDRSYTATQYALLASIGTAGRTTLASSSGALVDWLNGDWGTFFILTAIMVIPSLILLWFMRNKLKLSEK